MILILLSLILLCLLVLALFDLKYKAVPDFLLLILMLLYFCYAYFVSADNFIWFFAFIGAGVVLENFVSFYIQNIKRRLTKNEDLMYVKAMGEGDLPVIGVIGGLLGLELGIYALITTACLAVMVHLGFMLWRKSCELPFIPFLLVGLVGVFFTHHLLLASRYFTSFFF